MTTFIPVPSAPATCWEHRELSPTSYAIEACSLLRLPPASSCPHCPHPPPSSPPSTCPPFLPPFLPLHSFLPLIHPSSHPSTSSEHLSTYLSYLPDSLQSSDRESITYNSILKKELFLERRASGNLTLQGLTCQRRQTTVI